MGTVITLLGAERHNEEMGANQEQIIRKDIVTENAMAYPENTKIHNNKKESDHQNRTQTANSHRVHHKQERKAVAWFSTREEPIIYINGQPFVLRHEDNPKQNIKAYAGINGKRVEQMEDRLVEDVWKETEKANGLFMVHHETGNHPIALTVDTTLYRC
jgi:hypothetical protein